MNNKSQTSNLKSQTSTICALATAPGGALGIIRISGPQTLEILSRIFTKDLRNAQPNTIHYGHIIDQTSNLKPQTSNLKPQTSNLIDEVMVSIFKRRRQRRNLLPWLTLHPEQSHRTTDPERLSHGRTWRIYPKSLPQR